ncbi:unnamed protein product [Arctogadus glacialis]
MWGKSSNSCLTWGVDASLQGWPEGCPDCLCKPTSSPFIVTPAPSIVTPAPSMHAGPEPERSSIPRRGAGVRGAHLQCKARTTKEATHKHECRKSDVLSTPGKSAYGNVLKKDPPDRVCQDRGQQSAFVKRGRVGREERGKTAAGDRQLWRDVDCHFCLV